MVPTSEVQESIGNKPIQISCISFVCQINMFSEHNDSRVIKSLVFASSTCSKAIRLWSIIFSNRMRTSFYFFKYDNSFPKIRQRKVTCYSVNTSSKSDDIFNVFKFFMLHGCLFFMYSVNRCRFYHTAVPLSGSDTIPR